ncbi:MAG: tRNA pseudouridine(55) synthase TruB [Kiritimatiellae bacterium]|nr:tRNA pseudouridine(55) synthase TruB [Kiritimatiellia bacterium]MDD5519335.1 tRNA pseudouridine(55) synthase TruB [Kiritimatiellia bacterium]
MPDARFNYKNSAPALRSVNPYDGILLVDKPSGPTSHDIVAAIRGRFRFNKVGHGGTLDPQATGLLVILLGKGTKLSSRFAGSDKNYEGTLHLGISTDSQDAQGNILREADYSNVTREQIEAETKKLTGDIMQMPPMVSAVKIGGVPLYKRARKGETVEREPKLIHVYEFRLLSFTPPQATFFLRCSKGTYVRTLCSDIGDSLGCGAHLEQLRRTRCGDFRIEDAVSLDNVMNMDLAGVAEKIIGLHKLAPGILTTISSVS